ncbi:hypothetical protein [Pseudorhodoferax sp.]|uniref:hypothetical protein n=1 Tax=Pseudorhodoferax sp. TaxID=1993553 RepID=UPI002DD618CD|nr:hypothetical protein [Pseudorhodoferax sp.]
MRSSAPLLALAAALVPGTAPAACKPLLDAVDAMARQTRYALYEVSGPQQPLPAEPEVVLIGAVSYVRDGRSWERVDIADSLGASPWATLRKEVAAGQVRCRPAGSGSYRGAAVNKMEVERLRRKDGARFVWIDRRSGLPVYEGDDGEGIAVLYGDAVKEPRLRR